MTGTTERFARAQSPIPGQARKTRQRFEPLGEPATVVVERVMSRLDAGFYLAFAGAWTACFIALAVVGLRSVFVAAYPIVAAAIYWIVFVGILRLAYRMFQARRMRRPRPLDPAPGLRVALVTTFVPSHEPFAMLEETLAAMAAVRYPHDAYVLDEGDAPEVRELCERLGVIHFTRVGRPEYNRADGTFKARTKAGNLNAWLDAHGYAGYDVVTFLDPDHVPAPEYLDRVLGYLRDPEVGWVQAPQNYKNQGASFVARGTAEQTFGYYGSYLMGLYGLGVGIIDGCHTTFRLETLRRIGGYPVHIGEDLLMTYVLARENIGGVYHPEILARGLAPISWQAYLVQQYRWAYSGVNIKLHHFLAAHRSMPVIRKVVFLLHGMMYLYHGLAPLGIAILCSLLVFGGMPAIPFAFFWLIGLQIAISMAMGLWLQKFHIDPTRERGLFLRSQLLSFGRWPTLARACRSAVRNRPEAFQVTHKDAFEAVPMSLFRAQIFVGIAVSLSVAISLLRDLPHQGTLYFIAGVTLFEVTVVLLSALVISRQARRLAGGAPSAGLLPAAIPQGDPSPSASSPGDGVAS